MSKLTASYLAGFIDGEGYIALRSDKQYYAAILKVASTDEWIIKWIQESYGGSYYKRIGYKPNHKDSYYWTLNGKKLKVFLQKIQPYLKLKKEQCRLVLKKIKLQELKNLPYRNISRVSYHAKQSRKENAIYRAHIRKQIQEIYLELRRLNKRGK